LPGPTGNASGWPTEHATGAWAPDINVPIGIPDLPWPVSLSRAEQDQQDRLLLLGVAMLGVAIAAIDVVRDVAWPN
jgi:hypothetical protein